MLFCVVQSVIKLLHFSGLLGLVWDIPIKWIKFMRKKKSHHLDLDHKKINQLNKTDFIYQRETSDTSITAINQLKHIQDEALYI